MLLKHVNVIIIMLRFNNDFPKDTIDHLEEIYISTNAAIEIQ